MTPAAVTASSATTQVRVAVRIRPLTPQEVGQGANQVVQAVPPTVGIGERRFTYDAVFDSHVTQSDLYGSVSSPLLKSFLEGYNATIMAYGQTGSGKTFTMGSEAHADGEEMCLHPGLIPRFMSEVFEYLEQRKNETDTGNNNDKNGQNLLEYRVSASFLEVYGEDVHDLLDIDRKTLPLREDANGGVVVQGLTSRSVSNTEDALKVLHEGTMNRTTAATLMNLHSSRSHAVFSVHLRQTTRATSGGDLDVTTTSCFTFVDLAGSERMKKTGAEGERAKEGIKINEGLLALGNVINALADQERLSKEKKIHVPYRQSKLTRLLQDALGGNSQTLFLACVSPADSNASETLSTLHYANRARNIKNAPTKNVDASIMELQRLHALTHVLQSELVKSRFGQRTNQSDGEVGHVDENLMNQQDVQDYIESLHRAAEARQGSIVPVKPQRSFTNNTGISPFGPLKTPAKKNETATTPSRSFGDKSASKFQHLFDPDDLLLDEVNPDEEMAILDQLLELQHRDSEYEKEHKSDEEELKKVEGEIEEQEGMLLQLRESLRVYHTLKAKYEVLMGEVQQLEKEKANLAEQLERAVADPSKGCSLAIKKKLEKVEVSLARARNETRKHQQKYRKAEQQAQKSRVLERKIVDLKKAKVELMKKQKESAARHREYTEAKTREIMTLKRKERSAGQKVSKLEAEIRIHKANLEKRKDYCTKLSGKLKQTESHLMKLLAIRKKELQHRTSLPPISTSSGRMAKAARASVPARGIRKKQASASDTVARSSTETKSILFLLDKAITEFVSRSQTKRRYEERVAEYSDAMRDLIAEVKLLNDAKKKAVVSADERMVEEIRSREQNVEDLELKLELVGSDLETLKLNLPTGERVSSLPFDDETVGKVLGSADAPKLRTVLKEILTKLTDSETERQRLADALQRKDSTLESFNNEVDTLNSKISVLSKEIAQRTALSSSGDDQFGTIERLTAEKSALSEELIQARTRASELSHKVDVLKVTASQSSLERSEIKEKLIVAEAIARQHSEANPSVATLDRLQGIWRDLGVSDTDREATQAKIQTCLEDTCNRIVDEASALKSTTIAEIECLEKELISMHKVLGKDPPILSDIEKQSVALLPFLESLRQSASMIRPEYSSAVERRANLVHNANALLDAIGSDNAKPSSMLTEMIELHKRYGGSTRSGKEQRAEVLRNVQGMVASLDRMVGSFPIPEHDIETSSDDGLPSPVDESDLGPAGSLREDMLDACEKEVSRLRLLKSEMLVQNSGLREKAASLVKEMHLTESSIVALTEQVIQLQDGDTRSWWSKNTTQQVARVILDSDRRVLTTASFAKHLDTICSSMEMVATHRRLLSQALKSAVDRAQKTLLMTVDGETDVSEAYASFHDALFQLPPLSKEHVDACITELNALVAGVDAMTQSEVEALSVVWEALGVKPNQRSNFWSMLEEETTLMQSKDENLFGEVRTVDAQYREDWVVVAADEARQVYGDLSMRLFKLEKIHQSVETLRSRQDAKSRIISLDSELRILSAKLGDFEDKRCNKTRLLSKKSGSGALLKEERFRKQMQVKFASKLEQLSGYLRVWIETEGESFDSNLLSDEVRSLLDNADQMDTYVEKRTEFMHLNLKSTCSRPPNDTFSSRSRSNETRSRSPAKHPRSRTRSRDEPSPAEARRSKVARTSRAVISSSSPKQKEPAKTVKGAVVKRKPDAQPRSPTRQKIRRTGYEQNRESSYLSPKSQQANERSNSNPDKPKRTITSSRVSQKLLPFGHLLSGASSPQGKENDGST